jgi:hypothetical protein
LLSKRYFFFLEVVFFAADFALVAGLPAFFLAAAMKFHLQSIFLFMHRA